MSNTKKVIVIGKHHTETINKTDKQKRIRVNAIAEEPTLDEELNILLRISDGNSIDNIDSKCRTSLERKINGYKQQDIKKYTYDADQLVSLSNVTSKLIGCSLKCYYCTERVKLLYRVVRDPKQWTLDRIDNDLCHSDDNTVVCCLSCNLKRRVTDHEKFNFTKRMVLVKKDT